ncbi:MAG: chemotaxis-specific protein-glutamate methyltransferase CheB [Deltaproteobacteria bacterium]|jgi:two-component system chemotaxis response regulator CheB|nr:chemotaxis-specific protein-glutamate methyltransferase CheB [Deltaproteobacteria bacterium]MBK8236460.1 chemotaxis-specific protein-glutamate methyltransferase CheB [Deltaproteobacteria bacterium]MBP7288317.1 chemotaxis-specific protein-glutamate methyltransferase CheB [Nannocystaceae bacterium]
MTVSGMQRLRVLVVDDSAYNRQTIATMLESLPGVDVVGRATNGKEALRLVFDVQPDVITLDLEMPEMDGFAFLRLLMHRRPTPVIVISSHAAREHVFRALELGALDFVPKPGGDVSPELRSIEQELLGKVTMVRRLQSVRLSERARALQRPPAGVPRPVTSVGSARLSGAPQGVIAIAASTGGPPALQQLLSQLPRELPVAIVIAQHMPPRFTRAFAERLDRLVPPQVVEAEDGMALVSGTVYIAPGGAHLELALGAHGPLARVSPAAAGAGVITPSADRLFRSAATLFGPRMCAVVMTGMGSDGTDGAAAARAAGARVLAEDPSLAVMSGMPRSAVDAGVVQQVASIDGLARAVLEFAAALTGVGTTTRSP